MELIHSTQRSAWKKWSRLAFSSYRAGRGTEIVIWTWVRSRAEPRRLKWVREVRAGCDGKEADLGAGGSGSIQHMWTEAHPDCFPQDLGSPKTAQRSLESKWNLPHPCFVVMPGTRSSQPRGCLGHKQGPGPLSAAAVLYTLPSHAHTPGPSGAPQDLGGAQHSASALGPATWPSPVQPTRQVSVSGSFLSGPC